jgi:hypothetical protein
VAGWASDLDLPVLCPEGAGLMVGVAMPAAMRRDTAAASVRGARGQELERKAYASL